MCNNNTSISNPTSRESFEWDGTKITKFVGNETDVVIPEGTTEIGHRAFDGCQKLTIYAPAGSKAEEYAKEKNIPFQVK